MEEQGVGRKVGMLFLIITFCNVYLDRDTVIIFKKSLSTKHM